MIDAKRILVWGGNRDNEDEDLTGDLIRSISKSSGITEIIMAYVPMHVWILFYSAMLHIMEILGVLVDAM